MPIRRIDITLPSGDQTTVAQLCGEDICTMDSSEFALSDGRRFLTLLLDADAIEPVLDRLHERFEGNEQFRAAVMEVLARLPDPAEEADNKQPINAEEDEEETSNGNGRIARNELIEQLKPGTQVGPLYLLTVFLSAVIAAAGLVRDSAAVVIGAMVIAPLLLPNMSLALATTLGDLRMGWRSLRTNAAGVALVLAFAVGVGLIVPFDETVRQIAMRTEVGVSDIAIALAAGTAGAVAVSSGVSANLIGVMVAVALLPPMVTLGLLLGAGHFQLASGTGILLAINIACVNLAAVATFLARGVRPNRDQDRAFARSASMIALVMWLIVIGITAWLIWLSGAFDQPI